MVANTSADDEVWMNVAISLSEHARGTTAPNPNVGCIIVKDGQIAGRGWTQPGGRPHAEAMALSEAGDAAAGSNIYVTLEPCAHDSPRGPACVDLVIAARPSRVIVATVDPDPRTRNLGIARIRAAGIEVVDNVLPTSARRSMAGFITRILQNRPYVTLKLAMSIDGRIALPSGESQWISGPEARAHTHVERAKSDAILVGRGTFEIDRPRLDVRIDGMQHRSPRRVILSSQQIDTYSFQLNHGSWTFIASPSEIASLPETDFLLVEGGAGAAASFLRFDLVDRLLIYRAPILIGAGKSGLADFGVTNLADAHRKWRFVDTQTLGSDRLEVYERDRPSST